MYMYQIQYTAESLLQSDIETGLNFVLLRIKKTNTGT